MSTPARTAPKQASQSSAPTKAKMTGGVVLTPLRLLYVLAFWVLNSVADVLNRMFDWGGLRVTLYIGYFLVALLVVAYEYIPRRDPAAEGLRRAYRLLPVDPGMALVRGRGALEHSLREGATALQIPINTSDGQASIFDVLAALQKQMPADTYRAADHLRRLANEAAHDPDWLVDRGTAKEALSAALQVRRWVRWHVGRGASRAH